MYTKTVAVQARGVAGSTLFTYRGHDLHSADVSVNEIAEKNIQKWKDHKPFRMMGCWVGLCYRSVMQVEKHQRCRRKFREERCHRSLGRNNFTGGVIKISKYKERPCSVLHSY